MEIRKYSYYSSSQEVASLIASEVIRYGKSEGWGGSLDELSTLQDILARYNIGYVDDMIGKWAYYDFTRVIV
jgi:hypothetical protein